MSGGKKTKDGWSRKSVREDARCKQAGWTDDSSKVDWAALLGL